MSKSLYTTFVEETAPTTTTVGVVGQLYLDTSVPALYQCTAVDTANSSYTWTAVGGGIDTLSGTTAPTSSTIGKLGQIYIDTAKNCSYVCIQTNNTTYSRWINIGGGGSKLGSGNTNSYMLGSATDVGDNSVNINGYGTASSSSCVNIGALSGSSSNRNRSTAVGYRANYDANDALALGYYSSANANKSIQIGAGTNTTENSLQIFNDNIYKAGTHTLTVQNIELNGEKLEKKYIHYITCGWTSYPSYTISPIITNSSEPFTISTFKQWLTDNNFNSSKKALNISGMGRSDNILQYYTRVWISNGSLTAEYVKETFTITQSNGTTSPNMETYFEDNVVEL